VLFKGKRGRSMRAAEIPAVMANFDTIAYRRQESIARITLNRPSAMNVYSIRMRDELFEVLEAIRTDQEIRAVVVDGAGEKAFCAGADLSEFLTAASPNEARLTRNERDIWSLFLQIRQPVIAALHGYVIGSGIEIAMCCDIRLASDDVRFRLPEPSLGILPGAGGTQTLPRAVGRGAALDMLMTNRWVDASEARRIGLVNRVVPRAMLLPATFAIAEQIAARDARAVRLAKQAATRGLDLPLSEGLDLERKLARLLYHQRARNVDRDEFKRG